MKIEKVKKLVANLHDQTENVIHIRNLKQALNHGLVLKKVHRVIQFNQNVLLKPYIDMNTDLTKKAKNDFEKDLFKLVSNTVFGKKFFGENRDVKLVTTKRRRNYNTKFLTEILLVIEMKFLISRTLNTRIK